MTRTGAAIALVFASCLAGCSDDEPTRMPVPGAIYVVEGSTLVRYTGTTRSELGRELYPSAYQLPDGRLVAIASRGDGSAAAEQLALVGRDGKVERVGPAAMQVRDPAVDPRGRWIVVAANLDGHSDLYRIELDAAGAGPSGPLARTVRLTDEVTGNFHPALVRASTGAAIVYVSSRDGNAELYRDGHRLTAFQRDDWEPTPSPLGDTLAFLSDREGPARVFLMAPDGTSLRRLTTRSAAVDESAPVWSPDGQRLAYVAGGQVWVHELATGAERTVTPESASDLEPAWSPDGTWLAVSRTRGTDSDVWLLPLTGGEPAQLARGARLPRWL